jgi:hypothetical protein
MEEPEVSTTHQKTVQVRLHFVFRLRPTPQLSEDLLAVWGFGGIPIRL